MVLDSESQATVRTFSVIREDYILLPSIEPQEFACRPQLTTTVMCLTD